MRKAYFIALGVSTFVFALFFIPGLPLVFSFLTIGLGLLILFPLPYIVAVLWAALPAVILWEIRIARYPLLGLGAAVLAFVVFMPMRMADDAFAVDQASQADLDPAPIAFDTLIGVEIHRPADMGNGERVDHAAWFYGRQVCFELCERLLTGGDVAWVRIVITNDRIGGDRFATHALLIAGDPTACGAANPEFQQGARCALFAPDHGRPADLTVKITENWSDYRGDPATPYQPSYSQIVAGYAGADETAPLAFRRTRLFHNRPSLVFGPDISTDGGGFVRTRTRVSGPRIDPVAMIAQLGLAVAPRRSFPTGPVVPSDNVFMPAANDPQATAYVASLVATGPEHDRQFTRPYSLMVLNWMDPLRWQDSLSAVERQVFCASIASNDFDQLAWADQVIRKHELDCAAS